MNELDMSIDEAKARFWIKDVYAEIADVHVLLRKVSAATTDIAGTDDTIMNGIYNIGVSMENAWEAMCKAFDGAQNKIEEAISTIGKTVTNLVDEVDTVRKNF